METNKEKSWKIEYTKIKNTPFTIAKKGGQYYVLLGNYQLSEKPFNSIWRAKKYCSHKNWELLINLASTIVDITLKNKED